MSKDVVKLYEQAARKVITQFQRMGRGGGAWSRPTEIMEKTCIRDELIADSTNRKGEKELQEKNTLISD